MSRTWQQTQSNIVKRAQMLLSEVVTIRHNTGSDDIADMAYGRKGKEHHTRTLCRYLREKLSPDVLQATEAIQVHGLCGGQEHSWFKIMPDAEALAQTGDEEIQPDWHYIIDPQHPEVIPQVLLIAPTAPMQYMYEEHEAEPCWKNPK